MEYYRLMSGHTEPVVSRSPVDLIIRSACGGDPWLKNEAFCKSTFSQIHKVGNNGINANFVFPYICSFLHFLDLRMLVKLKLDVIW